MGSGYCLLQKEPKTITVWRTKDWEKVCCLKDIPRESMILFIHQTELPYLSVITHQIMEFDEYEKEQVY